jgi:hypothetical protein
MKGLIPPFVEKKPFIAPNANPVHIPAKMADHTGAPSFMIAQQTAPDAAMTDPTERSIQPKTNSIVIPTETRSIGDTEFKTVIKLSMLKK